MKKKSKIFPISLITLFFFLITTTVLLLLVAPKAAREIQWQITDVNMTKANFRLNNNSNALQLLSNASKDLATFVEPSVVHISANRLGRRGNMLQVGVGSGWIWDDNGHIITNWHVIEDASEAEIMFHNGITKNAKLIGADRLTDIALLKVDDYKVHPASRLDPQSKTLPGELVFAFGSPFGYAFSVSSGIVSAIGRSVSSIGMQQYQDFIQVDAAINQGNSGGPLTNCLGEVVGMNTAIIASSTPRGGGNFAGIGLAIPIRMIESVVNQILESGSVDKGFLGIGISDPDNTLGSVVQNLGLSPLGLMLGKVSLESSLYDIGLRSGDLIIECEGEPTLNKRNFSNLIKKYNQSSSITLLIQRHDFLRNRPIQFAMDINVDLFNLNELTNAQILDLNEPLREYLEAVGLPSRGIMINNIQENSAAESANLPKGGLIVSINDDPVNSSNQLTSRISSIRPGTEIILEIAFFDPEKCTIDNKKYKVILISREILSNFSR